MIVIHIGLKKSGSASIQAFLNENERELRALSIDNPTVGRKKAHHNFAYEIQGHRRFRRKRGMLSQCAEYWRQSSNLTLVVSSEMFEDTEAHQAAELHRLLREARGSEEFRIYLIVRDLVDLIPSSYAQKVKYGYNTFDFDTFFSARLTMRRMDHYDTARRWAEAFGWESLQVRVLDPAQLINRDLIDDFLDVCGVTAQSDRVKLKRPGIRNVTPGWRVVEATRALCSSLHGLPSAHPLSRDVATRILRRKFGKEFAMRMAACAAKAGEIRGWNEDRGQYLTFDQAQLCFQTYRRALLQLNEKLTRKLGIPLDLDKRGFIERKFLPDASQIPQAELHGFYDDLWELLCITKPDDCAA